VKRRDFLAASAGILTGALAIPAAAQPVQNRSLRDLAEARGLVFGAAAATYMLGQPDFVPVLRQQVRQLVPEYEMKRQFLEPQRGRYDFSALDRLFAFAAASRMSMRGHPLVWYASNPGWLGPALAARRDEKLLTGHIQAVLGRYRGRMASVDVVNEAIAPDGRGLRPSPWLSAFGPGYLDTAFHAARAADPAVKLVYNDWGCEQGGPDNDRFRAATLKLLDGLLARRVPMDALGLQGHLNAFKNRVDQRKLRDFLGEVRARGLAILVTELDVYDGDGPADIAARDRAVADETRRFLDVALDNPATRAVLTWCLSDRHIDPPEDWRRKLTGFRHRKLPYDAQMKKKPMWDAIAQAFATRRAP